MSRKRRHEDASEDDVFVYYEHTDVSSIPLDITSLRIDSTVKKIPPGAFREQLCLKNVEYEEGLEVIGDSAFYQCVELREQKFPSTLVEIGKYAFDTCNRLESVGRLPLSLAIIGGHAFIGCKKMKSIELHDAIRLEDVVFGGCSRLTHCRLPRGMVTIPAGLFCNCASLVDVDIPSSVIAIGKHAFYGCKKLAVIALPAGLKTIGCQAFASTGLVHFHCPATVESIGNGTFACCENLETVMLPPKLEAISQRTFDYCHKLKDVNVPQYVVRIGEAAFRACKLTQLDLSRLNVTRIGGFAFAKCSNLRDISLPKTGLKRIEESSFEDCESLTHLWVPPSVEYIGNGAFAGCSSLLSVEVPETLKRLIFIGLSYFTEICGYESLVNICIPPSHELDEVQEYDFMEEMKLKEAEGSYPELVGKLKRRFNFLPLHRACYFQSYHSLQDNITMIRSIVRAGPRACDRVDFLGMTPFHILALSRRPWLNLFQELLSVSSVDIMKCRDVFGATPLDYLCKNHSSSAACVTISLLLILMEPRISFLGLEWWRDNVMSSLEEVKLADATILASKVTSVCKKLSKFERMEVLSLLEMSIWRLKVEEHKAKGSDAREGCRINCGSSIVLEHVIPFLGAD